MRGGDRIALSVEKQEPLNPVPHERSGSPAPSHLTAVPSLRNKRSFLSPGADSEAAANGAGYPGLSSGVSARRDSRASLGTAYGFVMQKLSSHAEDLTGTAGSGPNILHLPHGPH